MNTEWKLVPNSIHELIRSGDLETLLWKLNGVHEAESVRLALYSARQSMLAESASDESLDKKEIEKWKRDSKLLEAIQDGCWDVRFLSSSNGDAGDYNIGIEIVAHFMEKPQERVIGEDWNENLRTALEQAMTAEAYPPARPAPTSHPIPTGATGERDWELSCDNCNGSGHVFVKHQVAERKTDVQEFKEECEACDGRGFNIAFEDIPGIAEYVKSCRPAATVATGEDGEAQREAVMDAIAEALGDAYDCTRVWSAWGVRTMTQDDFCLVADDAGRLGELADAAIAAMTPAPAAGDALELLKTLDKVRALISPVKTDKDTVLGAKALRDLKSAEAKLAAAIAQQSQRKEGT